MTYHTNDNIQDAIDAASNGDTIKVYKGTYGPIVINKEIRLIGDPVIDGKGGIGIKIEANNTLVENMTIYNCSIGIYVHNASFTIQNVTINNCTIYNCTYGNGYGIYLWDVNGSNIEKCKVYDINHTGIRFNKVTNCSIYKCDIWNVSKSSSSDYSIAFLGSSYNNIIKKCNITKSEYGIYFRLSHHNDILNCNISNNDRGIWLYDNSHNNTILNNTLSNTVEDIKIDQSPDNVFTNNTVSSYPTTFDINSYSGDFSIKGVSSPPADPYGEKNLGVYLEIKRLTTTGWLNLTIYYNDSNVVIKNESTIKIWKYNTSWYRGGFYSWRGIDIANNKVFANITSFSTFAPLQDVAPPNTTKVLGEPNYKGIWVTSNTPIWLNATDNDSGVNATYYRIWNGTWHPADDKDDYCGNKNITFINGKYWYIYRMNGSIVHAPIYFHEECIHYLEYFSVDFAGNEEEIKNQTHFVDNTPPELTKEYGEPSYGKRGGILLEENFSAGVPPAGWTDTHNAWRSSSSHFAGGEAPEALLPWHNAVNGCKLYTYAIDTRGCAQLILQFKTHVGNYDGAHHPYTLHVQVSTDGINWNDVWAISPIFDYGPSTENILLTPEDGVGSSTLYIAFTFTGDNSGLNYWYIDDVLLYSRNIFLTSYTPIYINATDIGRVTKFYEIPMPWVFWSSDGSSVTYYIPNYNPTKTLRVNINYTTNSTPIELNNLTWDKTAGLNWKERGIRTIAPGGALVESFSLENNYTALIRYTVAWQDKPDTILARFIGEAIINQTGEIERVLINFDVHNNLTVYDFELEFINKSNTPFTVNDIIDWYDGWGTPPIIRKVDNGIEVIWASNDAIKACNWTHFGLEMNPSLQHSDFDKIFANWTIHCGVLSYRIFYRVWNNVTGWSSWYNGSQNQSIVFNLSSIGDNYSCKHYIEYYAIDDLGNNYSKPLNQTVFVDNIPPVTTINFDSPSFYVNGIWYVTSHTNITLLCQDLGYCAVGCEYLHWEAYIWNESTGNWIPINVSVWNETAWENKSKGNESTNTLIFRFNEECRHLIKYYGVDKLGNIEIQHEIEIRVDDTPPSAYVSIGTPASGNHLTTHTTVQIIAIDEGLCPVGGYYVQYNIWNGTAWKYDWSSLPTYHNYNPQFNFTEECKHYLWYKVWDELGNNRTYNKTFYVDDTPPTSYISLPNHSYVHTSTVITITATDGPSYPCATGVREIDYRILRYNESANKWEVVKDWTVGGSTVSFNFTENCTHAVEFYAIDPLENVEPTKNYTYYVDTTPPKSTIEIGQPNCQINETAYCITTSTPLWLNASDLGCNNGSGAKELHYIIWYDNIPVEHIIYDNQEGDNNPAEGIINATIYIDEECYHKFDYWAVDYVGNVEDYHRFYFYVDDTTPVIEKEVGEPNCRVGLNKWCVSSSTPITINAFDTGCCNNMTVKIRIHNETMDTEWIDITSSLPYTFNFSQFEIYGCKHWLNITAYDCLGHVIYENETFYVDDVGPAIIKTVGEPNVTKNGAYWVNSSTTITVNAINPGCCQNWTVEYRIWYNGSWTPWQDITALLPYNITFDEECKHYLEIRAYDCLGRIDEDNETFYVDNSPPIGWKLIGEPKWPLDEGLWVTTHTPIILNATDMPSNECAVGSWRIHWEIYVYVGEGEGGGFYRIDNGTGEWNQSVTIYFDEECHHLVRWWTEDNLGNAGEENWQEHFVDDTPPVVTKEYGEPKYIYLCFDGVDDKVIVPNSENLRLTDAITIDAWIKIDDCGLYPIVDKIYYNTGYRLWIYCAGNASKLHFLYGNGTDYIVSGYSIMDIPLHEWTHVAVTMNDSGGKLYINGIEVKTFEKKGDIAVSTSPYAYLGIGYSRWNDKSFKGCIDDVRIYNKALSHSEILQNYYGNVITDGLVSWWKFNEGHGTTAYDSIDNNDGTIYGASYVRYITSSTPIYINATDAGLCPVGSYRIWYRIGIWNESKQRYDWGEWSSSYNENVTIYIPEECKHIIEYYAEDDLGNAAYPYEEHTGENDGNETYYIKPGYRYGPDRQPNTADDDTYIVNQLWGPDGKPNTADDAFGADGQPGKAGVDDDGDNITDELDETGYGDDGPWGIAWCTPSSEASCLWWFADWYGYPELKNNFTSPYQLADLLGKNYLNTDPRNGTTDENKVNGLIRYINDVGLHNKICVKDYWINATDNYNGMNWTQFIKQELERCQDVILDIWWYNTTSHRRVGGHTVVLTSIGNVYENDKLPIDIMDPWQGAYVNGTLGPWVNAGNWPNSPGGLLINYTGMGNDIVGIIDHVVTVCPNTHMQIVYVDNSNPYSHVDAIHPHCQEITEENPLIINVTTYDLPEGMCASGIARIELWYRYAPYNHSFGPWKLFGNASYNGEWQWQFDITTPGYYQFCSIAYDNLGHKENKTMQAEAWVSIMLNKTITLYEGWNLITIPVKTTWTAYDLARNITGCEFIVRWNAKTQGYDRTVYVDKTGVHGQNFPIEPGVGYWIYVKQNTTLTIKGCLIEEINVTLYTGYNLLGWANLNATNMSAVVNGGEGIPGCKYYPDVYPPDTVAVWNASKQQWRVYGLGFDPTFIIENYPDDWIIEIGEAFFVYRSDGIAYWKGGRNF